MSQARIDWRGREVADRVMEAAREAIDETTAAAAAAVVAPRDRGILADNIVTRPARRRRHVITGGFGSAKRAYWGLFQEYRRPFLRPAADSEFPKVVARLRSRLS